MLRYFLLFAMMMMAGTLPQTGFAQASPSPRRGAADAQKIIDACTAFSKKNNDEMTTAGVRGGHLDIADCLEANIMRQIPVLFGDKSGWYEVYRERFYHLRYVYGRFYWNLDNDNIECPCGTMYEPNYAIELSLLMEKMLRDVIEKEVEYDLKPSFADVPK